MRRTLFPLALLLAFLAACESGSNGVTGTVPVPDAASATEDELRFPRLDPTAPPLAQASVSFYAVRGQDREAVIWYHARPGAIDSTRLARLRVRKESLVGDAQGTPLAMGDSVLITMTVVDTARQLIELQPSGLTFSANDPARLTLCFLEMDHDFNGDGGIDTADLEIENTFQIWAQERPGDPFVSLPSELGESGDEVETDIPGFTRYVVAY